METTIHPLGVLPKQTIRAAKKQIQSEASSTRDTYVARHSYKSPSNDDKLVHTAQTPPYPP